MGLVKSQTHLTLSRKQACIKLCSAARARYYFQRAGGVRYERDVPIEDVVRAFAGNVRMRLRIRLADSLHTVVGVSNKAEQYGYVVGFD